MIPGECKTRWYSHPTGVDREGQMSSVRPVEYPLSLRMLTSR
jgi:hypothetical protein